MGISSRQWLTLSEFLGNIIDNRGEETNATGCLIDIGIDAQNRQESGNWGDASCRAIRLTRTTTRIIL